MSFYKITLYQVVALGLVACMFALAGCDSSSEAQAAEGDGTTEEDATVDNTPYAPPRLADFIVGTWDATSHYIDRLQSWDMNIESDTGTVTFNSDGSVSSTELIYARWYDHSNSVQRENKIMFNTYEVISDHIIGMAINFPIGDGLGIDEMSMFSANYNNNSVMTLKSTNDFMDTDTMVFILNKQ